jgi:cell division protein FtsQ
MMQRILHLSSTAGLLALAIALVAFAATDAKEERYAGIEVEVQQVQGMYFVDVATVQASILQHDSITGSFQADVNLHDVASWVKRIPAVQSVEVYPSINRHLKIKVVQREPHARLHLGDGKEDVYLDRTGRLLPLSPHFTARVPIIHAIDSAAAGSGYHLIRSTEHSPFWAAFIDQVICGPGQLDVIPRIGRCHIAFGDTTRLDEKLHNLALFYREQVARGNLNQYEKISLEFKGQVVAKRYF